MHALVSWSAYIHAYPPPPYFMYIWCVYYGHLHSHQTELCALHELRILPSKTCCTTLYCVGLGGVLLLALTPLPLSLIDVYMDVWIYGCNTPLFHFCPYVVYTAIQEADEAGLAWVNGGPLPGRVPRTGANHHLPAASAADERQRLPEFATPSQSGVRGTAGTTRVTAGVAVVSPMERGHVGGSALVYNTDGTPVR